MSASFLLLATEQSNVSIVICRPYRSCMSDCRHLYTHKHVCNPRLKKRKTSLEHSAFTCHTHHSFETFARTHTHTRAFELVASREFIRSAQSSHVRPSSPSFVTRWAAVRGTVLPGTCPTPVQALPQGLLRHVRARSQTLRSPGNERHRQTSTHRPLPSRHVTRSPLFRLFRWT